MGFTRFDRLSVGFASLALVASLPGVAHASVTPSTTSSQPRYRELAPGIEIRRFVLPGPVRGLALRVDPTVVALHPVTATGDASGFATLRAVAHRERALVAVNGDLASGSGPAHLLISDGRWITKGHEGGAVFAFDRTGRRVVLVAGRPGPVARGVSNRMPEVEGAFGGYPWLVHAGSVRTRRCGPLTCALHPRTAVGVTRGCADHRWLTRCRILIVVVDGRRLGWSMGMTTDDLASLMVRLGAFEAINLDGGASSQALLRGRSLNRVAPGARRAVVSALILRQRRASSAMTVPRSVMWKVPAL